MKTVVIIQARLGSTRLPGKVLLDLAGEPMLARVVNRVRRARRVDEVVIATTTETRDDELERICTQRGWPCYRGSEQDVLDRYYQASKAHGADVIVRITSDCPLIEPTLIDAIIERRELEQADFTSNTIHRTYPRGLDTEVFPFAVLETAWCEDRNPAWREHVTPFITNHPERFSNVQVTNGDDHSNLRWTVDTPEDFALVQNIFTHFQGDEFTREDVLAVLAVHPEWVKINAGIEQKVV